MSSGLRKRSEDRLPDGAHAERREQPGQDHSAADHPDPIGHPAAATRAEDEECENSK